MAHVIASRRLRFVDAAGEHEVIPSETAQPFPDRFLMLPYFAAAAASGWIQRVALEESEGQAPQPAPRKKRNVIS